MNPLIPDGLPELLQDFTVEVLRSKPTNLIEFAAAYFQELRDKATMGSQCSSPSGVAVTPKVDEDVAGNDHVNDDDDFRPPPTFNRGRRASGLCLSVLFCLVFVSVPEQNLDYSNRGTLASFTASVAT
jgi:cAMP-dependent protein kinase regulator